MTYQRKWCKIDFKGSGNRVHFSFTGRYVMKKKIILACLLVLTTKAFGSDFKDFDSYTSKFKTINKKEEKTEIFNLTTAAEKQFKIKKELLWALMATESAFRNIKNGASIGYTQLQLLTARDVFEKNKAVLIKMGVSKPKTIKDLSNPKTQILISAAYIKDLKEKFNGNLRLALRAYNAGPSGYKKAKNDWYFDRIQKQMLVIPN